MERRTKGGLLICDLDSTLMDTGPVFYQGIDETIAYLSSCVGDGKDLRSRFNFHQMRVRATEHVNPHTIWPLTLAALRQEYNISADQCRAAIEIMMNVYTLLPLLYEGIREALIEVRKMGMELNVLTHAEPGWTDFKVDGHNLRDYFERIYNVNVNGPKTSADWKAVLLDHPQTPSDYVWAMGDNVTADVIAALEAGIPNVVYANFSPGNEITKNALVPKEAYVANHPSEVPLIISQYS